MFGGHADARYGGGGAGLGGAIFNDSGGVLIENNTFTNNFVTRGVAGGGSANNGADAGGAIFSANGHLRVHNATISGNQSTGSGGGIVIVQTSPDAGTLLSIDNTIIYNNGSMDANGNLTAAANECSIASGFSVAADGAGNLNNGFTDTFLALNTIQGTLLTPQTGAQISAPFTGTYSVDSTGTGRASSTGIIFNPEPKNNYLPTFFFYLTGNGGPALVLEGGDTHYPSIGTGIAYPQSTGTPAFSGDYGIIFTQELSGSSENDGAGPFNANPTAMPPSLSGITDINIGFGANQDQPFAGTFATPSASGPFPGVLVGANTALITSVAFVPQIAVNYYFVDPTQGFFIETDLVNGATPEQPGQVSIGYYEVRTPVCSSCQ